MADWSMVLGSSGLVGRALSAGLQQRGVRQLLPLRSAPPMIDAASAAPMRCQVSLSALQSGGLRLPAGWDERGCAVFLSALGTTRRKAGSAAAFMAIDHDLVLACASLARQFGARQAIVISSVGADAGSGNLYLRVKGELERDVAALGFPRCDFLRPGLLLGARPGDARPTEALLQSCAPKLDWLLPGGLQRYRSIAADRVARAAITLHGARGDGLHRHEYADLQRLGTA